MLYYKQFESKLDKVLTDEDIEILRSKDYYAKREYVELKLKDILEGENKEFKQDVAFNKEEYLTEAVCQYARIYKQLTPEQKMIVLANVYPAYNFNPDGSRTYLDSKQFLQELDNGRMNRHKMSAVGLTIDYMSLLPELTPPDVIFWLQHEWHDLSGDWFWKLRYKDYITRNHKGFGPKHYQAFNEIFKQCFGRELKCINKFRNRTIIDEYKDALGD